MRNLLIQLALATVPALTGCTGSYVPTAAQPCPGLYIIRNRDCRHQGAVVDPTPDKHEIP
jgi:hypothetical protein